MADELHVLVLGGTGACGIAFCEEALRKEIRLTLYVRSPSKLSQHISQNTKVTVIQGTFEDADGLARAASSGATTFVSFAGPQMNSSGMPITNAYNILMPLLIANSYKRALVLSTASWAVEEDKSSTKWSLIVGVIRVFAPSAYREIVGCSQVVTAQDVDKLPWTLFRVPILTTSAARDVQESLVGDGTDGVLLSRHSLAKWVAKELAPDSKWIGKCPLIHDS